MITGKHVKLIRENDYMAEVEVAPIETDEPWAPYLSLSDVKKLDAVRVALRNKDFASASKLARIFRLTPLASAI